MDLKSYLHNPLLSDLDRIHNSTKILISESIGQYTDHTIEHSERIIQILNSLLTNLMKQKKTDNPIDLQPLNEHEIFILLAASYLHDVGMHYKKETDDLEEIRKKHNKYTYDMIINSVEDPSNYYNFGIPSDYVNDIAFVAKGHRKVDLLSSTYTSHLFKININIRVRLLAALLKLADELDITYQRVNLEKLKVSNVDDYSKMHWYKHYYVQGIGIHDGNIIIHFRLPEVNFEKYKKIISSVVFKDITDKYNELKDYLWNYKIYLNLSSKLKDHKFLKYSIEEMPTDLLDKMEKTFGLTN